MKIESISINTKDGKSYALPISSNCSPLEVVIKDALLNHLLSGNEKQSQPVGSTIKEYSPAPKRLSLDSQRLSPNSNAFNGRTLSDLLEVKWVGMDYRGKKTLSRNSSKFALNVCIVKYFYQSGNKWINRGALCRHLAENSNLNLAEGTIGCYLPDVIKSGILQVVTIENNAKEVRLSPAFINQAKQSGVAA